MRTLTQETTVKKQVEDAIFEGRPRTAAERSTLYERLAKKYGKKAFTAEFNGRLFAETVTNWYPLTDEKEQVVPESGVRDEAGELIECTWEARLTFALRNPSLAEDVLKALERLDSDREEEARGKS